MPWPKGKHNKFPALAADVAPCIDGRVTYDQAQCYYFAGLVLGIAKGLGLKHKVRWGGDWNRNHNVKDQSFNDLVHFELIV